LVLEVKKDPTPLSTWVKVGVLGRVAAVAAATRSRPAAAFTALVTAVVTYAVVAMFVELSVEAWVVVDGLPGRIALEGIEMVQVPVVVIVQVPAAVI
jgi:hypothetical protein